MLSGTRFLYNAPFLFSCNICETTRNACYSVTVCGFVFFTWNESVKVWWPSTIEIFQKPLHHFSCPPMEKPAVSFLQTHFLQLTFSPTTVTLWLKSPVVTFFPSHRAKPQHQMLTLVGQRTVMFAMSHWWQHQNFRHVCIVFSFIPASTAFIVSSGRTFIQILSWVLLSLPGLAWMGVVTDRT